MKLGDWATWILVLVGAITLWGEYFSKTSADASENGSLRNRVSQIETNQGKMSTDLDILKQDTSAIKQFLIDWKHGK